MSGLIDLLKVLPKSLWRKPRSESVEDRLSYPGDIPDTDYLLTPYGVIPMKSSFDGSKFTAHLQSPEGNHTISLKQFLKEYKLPCLEGRIPVITYGSNWVPDQLRKKMEDFIPPQNEDGISGWQYDDFVMPVTTAKLEDHLAVWSLYSSQGAYAFAVLKPEPDAQMDVGVIWVTKNQLDALTKSEPNYEMAAFTIKVDGKKLKALSYIAKGQVGFYKSDNGPIPLDKLNQSGPKETESMGQEGFMDLVDAETGLFNKVSLIAGREIKTPGEVSNWVKESTQTKMLYSYKGRTGQVSDMGAAGIIKAIVRDSGRLGSIDPSSYQNSKSSPEIIPSGRQDMIQDYVLRNQLNRA